MSKLVKWFGCGLFAALVLAICAPSNAAIILSGETPYTPGTGAPGTGTKTYVPGGGNAAYVSLADDLDSSVPTGEPNNNSLVAQGVNSALLESAFVAQGGFTSGLGPPWNLGLGELWRPTTGATYGSPNNQGFALNNFIVPIGGGFGTAGELTIKVTVAKVTLNTTGGYKDSNSTMTFDSIIDTGTFTWNTHATPVLATFSVDNPSEAIALDQTYFTYFEWTATATDTAGPNNNSLVWYRIVEGDPNGYGWRKGTGDADIATGANWVTLGASGGAHPRAYAMAINAVPEPATVVLLAFAAPGLMLLARRRRR